MRHLKWTTWLFSLLVCSTAWADPSSGISSGSSGIQASNFQIVETEDAATSCAGSIIKVTDGDLTDNSDGTCSIDTSGGASSAGGWTDDGDTVRLTTSGNEVVVGSATPVNSSKFSVDGDADQVQTTIQSHSTQTDSTFIQEQSDGTEVINFEDDGTIKTLVGLDAIGAVDLDIGSADVLDVTNVTDGGTVILDGSISTSQGATAAGLLIILEDTDDGSNNATFTVPALAADTDYILPPDDGDAGEQLQTNGSGTLTWEAGGAGGGGGWTDDGTTVRLDAPTDNVSIGATSEPSTEKLQVTGDTLTTGEFIEQTGSASTGNTVVTNNFILTPSGDNTITAAGGVTVTNAIMRVQSDGGEVNITVNPQIADGASDGQFVILQGLSDTDTLIFEDGNGLSMSASVTLGLDGILVFIWDSGDDNWIMVTSDTK